MAIVDVLGLNKADLLAALWNHAAGPTTLLQPPATRHDAAVALLALVTETGTRYVGAWMGRPLLVDLDEDRLDVTAYDALYGDGVAETAVRELLAGNGVNPATAHMLQCLRARDVVRG